MGFPLVRKKLLGSILAFHLLVIGFSTVSRAQEANSSPPPASAGAGASIAEPLDTGLKPSGDEEMSSVFRDMGVIQRKAMNKRNRFLLSSFLNLDFSDGPYTNYSLNLNPGYAVSDFLEVYAQFSPYFITEKRSIVDSVEQYTLQGGEQLRLNTAKPRYSYGLEVLWAPLYGKDSLGVSRIIRSDTFLKLGVMSIKYTTFSGLGFKLGVGKTFFLTKWMGFRFCANYGLIPSEVNNVKSNKSMLLLESGATFYF